MGFANTRKSVGTCMLVNYVETKVALMKDAYIDIPSHADTIACSEYANMELIVSIATIYR